MSESEIEKAVLATFGAFIGEAYGLILAVARDDSRSIAEHTAAHQADQKMARAFIVKWQPMIDKFMPGADSPTQ